MLRCIAIDDEPLALDLLEDNIRSVPFIELVARCRNAMEAMPKGGRLHVSVRESFDWTRVHHPRKGARLTIADSGCGIPKEHQSRILDPFFTTKTEKGNGLGLWISQGIISKHEGVLSLRSSDTKSKSGTIISLFLPSISYVAGSHAVEQSPPSERPRAQSRFQAASTEPLAW